MHRSLFHTLALLALLMPLSCMTMQTELPGVLDLRQDLAKAQDQDLEPKEPAFGRSDHSFLQGLTLSNSSEMPTQGHYKHPEPPENRSVLAPKVHTSQYRRIIRQWFLLGLFPIAGDQGLFAADMQSELSIPGSHLRKIRISSGQDIPEHFFRYIPVVGPLLALAPTRTTEVVAYIDQTIKATKNSTDDDIMLVPVPEETASPAKETTPHQADASSATTEHLDQPPVAPEAGDAK